MKALIDTEIYLSWPAAACEIGDRVGARRLDLPVQARRCSGPVPRRHRRDPRHVPDHAPVLAFGDWISCRYGVWPQYKANRKKCRRPAGYRTLVEWVDEAATARGWQVRRLPDIEGDGVLGVPYARGRCDRQHRQGHAHPARAAPAGRRDP